MTQTTKSILQAANAAIVKGDTEGFLSHCTDDVEWSTVGGETLHGKQAVREWMATAYAKPPEFTVDQLVAEGDVVIALGSITADDAAGTPVPHAYCDVWRVRDGKLAELRAFVIATPKA